MSTVAAGLRLMYAGVCIYLLARLAMTVMPQVSIELVMQLGGLKFLQTMFYIGVGAEVLYLLGMLLCLAVPGRTGAALAMYPAVLIALIGVGLRLWSVFDIESMVQTLPPKLVMLILQDYLTWAIFTLSTCLFLLSLRILNTYIGSPRNASRAWTTFWATLVLVGLLVAVNVMVGLLVAVNVMVLERIQQFQQVNFAQRAPLNNNDLLFGLAVGTLLFAAVWLILYLNTLKYTARALSDYERRGGRPADA